MTPTDAAVAETHISTVFFSASRAYKLLKPLATSFLDHTSVEARLAAVDDELALNRRLAPDVYLGTADVVENDELVDRMLVMRRLPADRRLSTLAGRADLPTCVEGVARRVAVFHAAETPIDGAEAREIAGRDVVRRNWNDNLAEVAPLVGPVVPTADAARVRELADRYLEHRNVLFEERIAGGFVRDGHGDLTADDIFCLDDGPRILDCLAFDRRLRIADVLADIAFLAMDLDRLDGPQTANELIDHYCRLTNEHHPPSLANHYVAYRASVRAKVAAIRHGQGDPGASDLLATYHDLCLRNLEQADVRLVLVGGTPATGKSTLSRALAGPLGAMVLSSDELRKDLAGLDHRQRDLSPPGEGIYTEAMSDRVYRELLDRSTALLDRGHSVILDASWNRAEHRRAAEAVADTHGATLIALNCVVDPAVGRRRIEQRFTDDDDSSDARPAVLDALRARHEPWPAATTVDTGDELDETIGRTLDLLGPGVRGRLSRTARRGS